MKEAEILDKLLDILAKDPEPNKPTRPWYMAQLQEELGIDKDTMKYMLDEQEALFNVQGKSALLGEYQGAVSATTKAKVLYKSGFKFVAEVENDLKLEELEAERKKVELEIQRKQDKIDRDHRLATLQLKERELKIAEENLTNANADKKGNRNWKIATGISTFLMLCFAAWAAWGSDNSKVYEKKELRLESKIDSLQTQIDAVTKQLNAIPDSIRDQYIK